MNVYIYAILNPQNNQVKIGWTADLHLPLRTLRQTTGVDFQLLAFEPSSNAPAAEQAIHAALNGQHRYGEWYELTALTLENLEDLIKTWAAHPPLPKINTSASHTLKAQLILCIQQVTAGQPFDAVAHKLDCTPQELRALLSGGPHVTLEALESALAELGYDIAHIELFRRN